MDDNTAPEIRPAGVGPGERLQAARIQQGLSVEDVASRMHLSTGILEAIEENNFDEITAPIFVKGYLRAYARIVSLDEDEMIQQYLEYYSDEDPPISSTANVAPELSVADARIRWTTYLVVIVLAVLLAAWWWNKGQQDQPAISLDAQAPVAEPAAGENPEAAGSEIQAASETLARDDQAPAAATPATAPESASETMQSDLASRQPPAAPADSAEPAGGQAPEAAPAMTMVETAPLETEAGAESIAGSSSGAEAGPGPGTESTGAAAEENVAETAAEVAAAPALPNTPGLIAPSGSDRLRIVVIADTWADIKDASGYQMVYDLLRAEQTLELVGQAPFSVFLGNGPGVEIEINDEVFEFTSRIRGDNTARLRIGG